MSLTGILLLGFGPATITPPNPPIGPAQPDLRHSPSDIIRHLLVNIGVGSLPSDNLEWPIYDSLENDSPDNAITIYCSSGVPMGRQQTNGVIPQQYGVQFRIRANSTVFGYRKASEIEATIDTVVLNNTVTVDSETYVVKCINRKGTVISLGAESPQTKRTIYTLNALATLERHSVT